MLTVSVHMLCGNFWRTVDSVFTV